VNDLLDQSTDVTVSLGEVEGTELGGSNTVVSVGSEDSSGFTLVADD